VERWAPLVASVRLLAGRPSRWVTHPSGLFVTPEPAGNHAPLERRYGKALAQLDRDGVEQVGLVKIDLLSNRALSALSAARATIRALGVEVSPPEGDTDAATLGLLSRGDTLGISQLETPSMRRLLAQMEPRGMTDLVQALALVRPGAAGGKELFLRRRRGLEPTRHLHPTLEPLLRGQHGVLLYEDDVLAVVQALTGSSAATADRPRKRLCDTETAEDATAAFL
jgi:DNA polymerase III alpha subunit